MSHPAILQGPDLPHLIGYPFTELKLIDSTNNYAMGQVHAGLASHGAAFFAHHQTAGKGQRSKSWLTGAGEAIALSIVLEPLFLPPHRQFELSMITSLACMDLLQKYVADDLKIKWPNDLYWRDRKAGGILIENGIQGSDWRFSIAGIGININQESFPEALSNPVSLQQITGKSHEPAILAKQLCDALEVRWQQLKQNQPGPLLNDYNQLLYKKDQPVRLKKDNAVFETTIRSVTLQGELLTTDTLDRNFVFGEVEWLF